MRKLVEISEKYAIGLHNGCGHTYNDGPYELHLKMVRDKVNEFKKYIAYEPTFD